LPTISTGNSPSSLTASPLSGDAADFDNHYNNSNSHHNNNNHMNNGIHHLKTNKSDVSPSSISHSSVTNTSPPSIVTSDEPDTESEKPKPHRGLRGSLVTPTGATNILSPTHHHHQQHTIAAVVPTTPVVAAVASPSSSTTPSSTHNHTAVAANIVNSGGVPLVPRSGALVGSNTAPNVHPSLTAHTGAHLLSPSYTPIKTATPSRIPVPARSNPILSPLNRNGAGANAKRDLLSSPPTHPHGAHHHHTNLSTHHDDRVPATAPPRHAGDDEEDHSARATSAMASLPGGSSVGGKGLLMSPHHNTSHNNHLQTQSARHGTGGSNSLSVGGSHSARSASPPRTAGAPVAGNHRPKQLGATQSSSAGGDGDGTITIGGDDADRLVLHWPKLVDHDDDGPPPPVPITRLNTELAARMTNSVVGTVVSSHRGEIGIMISGRGDISGRQPAMVSARGTVGPEHLAAMLNSARGTFRATSGGDVSARGPPPMMAGMGDLSARGAGAAAMGAAAYGLKISVEGVPDAILDSYRGPAGLSLDLVQVGPGLTPRPGTSLDSARLFIGEPLNVALNEKRHSFVVSGDSLLLRDGFDINARGVVNVPYLPRSDATPIPSPAISSRGLPSGRSHEGMLSGRESSRDSSRDHHHHMSSGRHAHTSGDGSPGDEVGEGKMLALDSSPGSRKRSGGYRLSKKGSARFNFPQDGGFLTIVQSRNTLEVPSPHARARRVSTHRQAKLGRNVGAADLERIGQLGHGQHGMVWKAIHKPTNTFCALKYTNIYEHDKRHQMRNELEAFSKISNPHIVNFMGAYFDAENVVTVYVSFPLILLDCVNICLIYHVPLMDTGLSI
jgi:hypothetical protein